MINDIDINFEEDEKKKPIKQSMKLVTEDIQVKLCDFGMCMSHYIGKWKSAQY